jgi:hypothetical protein
VTESNPERRDSAVNKEDNTGFSSNNQHPSRREGKKKTLSALLGQQRRGYSNNFGTKDFQ